MPDLGGRHLERTEYKTSLDLGSWEAAQKLVRDWEANPEGGGITVKERSEKFLADGVARGLSDGMMRKLKLVVRDLMDKFGAVALRSVTVDDIRTIRQSWQLAPITTQK